MRVLLVCSNMLKGVIISREDVGRKEFGFINVAPILLDRVMTVV